MEQAAGKLVDAAQKCKPHKYKPYLPEIQANLNAGRFDAALALMKVDASDDPTPQWVSAIKSFSYSMARAGRADDVDADIAFFKDNERVRDWLSTHDAKELKDIYSRDILLGTALFNADQGDLDGALEKGGFERVMRHLLNTGNDASAAQAIQIHSKGDVKKISDLMRFLWGTSEKLDLAMAKQYPPLAIDIVKAWNDDKEGNKNLQRKKLRQETFQEIAMIVSPEMRLVIEIEVLEGDYLTVEYQNRIAARFLQQFPAGDPESQWVPTLIVFDYLLRHNKLKDARKLFESEANAYVLPGGMELAERLYNAGDQQAAVSTLDRVLEMSGEEDDFLLLHSEWRRALKIGETESSAEFLKLSPEGDRPPAIVEMHREVRDAGFSSAKSVVDPLKACWDNLVAPPESEESLRSLRNSMLWEYLLAELAIQNDPKLAYQATLMMPKSIVGDPVEIGPVIKVLLARGQDQTAVAYAKCWEDSPVGSLRLGSYFFYDPGLGEIVYERKPETEQEIFRAIGDKLVTDRFYLEYSIKKALEKKDKEETLRLTAIGLTQDVYIEADEFTKLNWYEDLVELIKKTCEPDDADQFLRKVSSALFDSGRIDELILHLEKHRPLFYLDRPVRFNRLIGYANRVKQR